MFRPNNLPGDVTNGSVNKFMSSNNSPYHAMGTSLFHVDETNSCCLLTMLSDGRVPVLFVIFVKNIFPSY